MSGAVDQTSPMSAWLIGLFLGAISAIAMLEFGYAGMLWTVVCVALIAWKGPRLPAGAGLLTGVGIVLTLLFARVMVSCAAENLTPGSSCDAPGIGGWVAASLAILAAGAVLTVVAARRLRARR